jgi:hypothetical protein
MIASFDSAKSYRFLQVSGNLSNAFKLLLRYGKLRRSPSSIEPTNEFLLYLKEWIRCKVRGKDGELGPDMFESISHGGALGVKKLNSAKALIQK